MGSDMVLTPAQHGFIADYLGSFPEEHWEVTLAGQAGSQRNFFRIRERQGERSFVLVVWDARDEDWPRFLAIPAEAGKRCVFLPKIYKSDSSHGLILEEDLGKQTLHRYVREHRGDAGTIETAYCRVLEALCVWQSLGREASPAVAARTMDADTFLWETDYFARHCVADFCGNERVLSGAWEKERQVMAAAAASLPATFIHRDFQSENIMLVNGQIRFVDFQGARLGPPAYDAASLLFDPYAAQLDEKTSWRMFDYYSSLPLRVKSSTHDFFLCAAQRLMQACGAYGNLSVHKGKTQYRKFMPVALARLEKVMEQLPEYPAIKKVIGCCSGSAGTV